jgi:hypothetical protein
LHAFNQNPIFSASLPICIITYDFYWLFAFQHLWHGC